jgi:hypothetical protein
MRELLCDEIDEDSHVNRHASSKTVKYSKARRLAAA